ncbi:MAG: type II secretion system F family protein [Planctomycetota bacterium]
MATFEYSALTSAGRLMKGTLEASSPEQAGGILEEMGLKVNQITKTKEKPASTAIGRSEFLLFNQQLASITKAGIPLERALRELAHDISSKPMQRLVSDIADDLERGVSIDKAIAKRQRNFPAMYGLILKAGVETGRLAEMLASLNRHLDMADRTRRIIFESLCYPAVVFVFASIVLTGLFIFVIPQFESILNEMTYGAELPALTRGIFALTKNIIPLWTAVAIIAVLIFLLSTLLSGSPAGRRFRESVFLKFPMLGRLYHAGSLARLAEAMAVLVTAGADMPDCLRLSSAVSGSEKIKLECETIACQVEKGSGILEAGHFCRMIPRLFLYSVQLGSQRNELQDNLYGLSQMYSQQAFCMQGRLQAILMPAMIIALGVVVGTMVLAIFLPMIKIVTSLM